MLHRVDGWATRADLPVSRLYSHELITGEWMLPLGETCELRFVDRAGESPLRRQPPIPLAKDLLAFAVVVLARVAELLAMIPLRLSGAQRLRHRHHRRVLSP